MDILSLGRRSDGAPLLGAMDEDAFSTTLVGAMSRPLESLRRSQRTTAETAGFRAEEQRRVRDPGDPTVAGWSYLLNVADPRAGELAEIVRSLAVKRGMPDPSAPLPFHGEGPDAWLDWLEEHYHGAVLNGGSPPGYILILGGPDTVPFGFQAFLHSVASVGRLDFAHGREYQSYVDKVLRLEAEPEPVVARKALFFAPDEGPSDPTHFSREHMVKPLADLLRDERRFEVLELAEDDATKPALARALATERPALVYTASHGMGATDKPLDFQRSMNGGLCCQSEGRWRLEDLYSADDVPTGGTFLEGAVFFQFACHGYGTPAASELAHWTGRSSTSAGVDFVAALPKKLLAHPRGPISYVGHLDMAFLHGFTDPKNRHLRDRWHRRIAPFKSAVEGIVTVDPAGLAMKLMNERYVASNAVLTSFYDRQQRGAIAWTPERRKRLVDQWIVRGDAQNFMVLGDPAARLRVPVA